MSPGRVIKPATSMQSKSMEGFRAFTMSLTFVPKFFEFTFINLPCQCRTPLMMCCTKPNVDVVMALVQNGGKMKLTNKDGWNCFHIAAREGHTDILNYLLDCCEDIWDACSKNGRTPLHSAGKSDSEIKCGLLN